MKKLGFINAKGGVGKSTLALNLISRLAEKKSCRILGVDMDAQANLSQSLGVEPDPTCNISKALESGKFLDGAMKISDNIHLLSGSHSLEKTGVRIGGSPSGYYRLKKLIATIESDYDFIIFDSSATLNILTYNVLNCLDSFYIPMTPDVFGLVGIDKVLLAMEEVLPMNQGLSFGGIILNAYQKRKITQEIVKVLNEKYPGKVLETFVRHDIKFPESQAAKQPIFVYSPKSRGAKDIMNLVDEIEEKIQYA